MRQKILIGVIGTTLALGACGGGGGKASTDELGKAVIDALAKKDKAAFVGLYGKIDVAMDACPAMKGAKDELGKELDEHVAKATANFENCAKMDWTKAKVLETKGGDLKDADEMCSDAREVRDIRILAEVDGKKVGLVLDDPMQFGGKFYLWDRFECEEEVAKVEERPVAVAEPEKEPVVADKEAAAADPTPAEPAAAEPTAVAAAEPAAAAEPTAAAGTSECDKFVAAYEACLVKLPEAARTGAESGLKQMKEMFAKVPDKAMLESTCKQSYDSVKQAMGSFCPDAFK